MSVAGPSIGIWPVYDGVQPLQSLERARNLAANFLRRWRARRSRPKRWRWTHPCQSPPLRWRRKRGASEQAIGVTKGGRNSKLHALVDKLCRPWVIILTPGNIADCMVGPECASLRAGIKKLLGDKAYDSDSFRELLRQDGITPVIPGRSNRKKRIRYDKKAYKGRNVIERCYCRLKDFRRIATRCDKLAGNFSSSARKAIHRANGCGDSLRSRTSSARRPAPVMLTQPVD
jgi:transposase